MDIIYQVEYAQHAQSISGAKMIHTIYVLSDPHHPPYHIPLPSVFAKQVTTDTTMNVENVDLDNTKLE